MDRLITLRAVSLCPFTPMAMMRSPSSLELHNLDMRSLGHNFSFELLANQRTLVAETISYWGLSHHFTALRPRL
jgi:hypothetical protein